MIYWYSNISNIDSSKMLHIGWNLDLKLCYIQHLIIYYIHPAASRINSTDFSSLNPPLQLWFSLGLRNFARKCRKFRSCNSIFAIFTKGNVCCVDFTKKLKICAKSGERKFRELPQCDTRTFLAKISWKQRFY